MYRVILKYKQVIIKAAIFIFLILISIGFHKDFFLGAAAGAALVTLGESIGNLNRKKNENVLNGEKMSVIKS